MSHCAKLHGLAASARIANLPSVVSNVWLGCVLGSEGWFSGNVAVLMLAGVCLCLAGNFLNDWKDRAWDAVHRPERALPQRLFPAGAYLIVAVVCGLLGLGAAAAVSRWCLVVALVIGLNIIVYTRIHKHTVWAVIPMGLCRALLPVMGILGFVRPGESGFVGWGIFAAEFAPIPAGLFCHIAGLSLNARNEALGESSTRAMRCAPLLFVAAAALMFASVWLLPTSPLPLVLCVLGLLPYGLWITYCLTVSRRPVSRQVANQLAGIPLVDWIMLLPLALSWRGEWGGIPQGPALCLLLPPLAVLSGKLLQRLAPAT